MFLFQERVEKMESWHQVIGVFKSSRAFLSVDPFSFIIFVCLIYVKRVWLAQLVRGSIGKA